VRLTIFEELHQHPGPYTSVYLDTSRDSEEAHRRVDLRWQEAHRELTAQGAPPADLAAIAELIPRLRGEGPTGHAVFASGGTVRLAAELDGPPRRQIQRFAPLPHTMPMIAQVRETVPHVLVTTDRTGADITAVGHDGDSLQREVQGRSWPIRKVQTGGWSHRRYQQAAEDTWEKNAADVARAVTEAAVACQAEIVLVAGEERARSQLMHAFGSNLQAEIVEVAGGGRADGIDEEAFRAEVSKLLADRSAVKAALLAARYREELGQHDKATAGLTATISAL
jgi:hypothetical protein